MDLISCGSCDLMNVHNHGMQTIGLKTLIAAFLIAGFVSPLAALDEPWIITDDQIITEPTDVGDVIVAVGGSLTVRDVPDPGLRVSGHLWAIGESRVELRDSVIQFMSTYHGQYGLVSAENSRIEVSGCDYRVPNGVQHALVTHGNGELTVSDTDFGFVQLLAMGESRFVAERLNGDFEVLVMDQASMDLHDIPRDPDQGKLWVWPEFTPGSEAVYTPPMPGFVDAWTFPPPGSTGLESTVDLQRCETLLWPLLVNADSKLILRDISEENWIVVGLLLPNSAVIRGIGREGTVVEKDLGLHDRVLRLENASIDTWNLYTQNDSHFLIQDCHLGEIISQQSSHVRVERCYIDGTGGWFGSREESRMAVYDSLITCTVEAGNSSVLEFHHSQIRPYEVDPTGDFTRFGAFDEAVLFVHQTTVDSTIALEESGLIAVSYLNSLPPVPPSEPFELAGTIGLFSRDPEVGTGRWTIEAIEHIGSDSEVLAHGTDNVDNDFLALWSGHPDRATSLVMTLTDGRDRTILGSHLVRNRFGEPAPGFQRRPRPKKVPLDVGDQILSVTTRGIGPISR